MRNLLAFVALLTISFLGLGWYQNWYSIASQDSSPGRGAFLVEVDYLKIGRDTMEAARTVKRWLSRENKEEVKDEGKDGGAGTFRPPTSDELR